MISRAFILLLLPLVCCTQPDKSADCIRFVSEGQAVELWRGTELLGEFTPRNCDSASLATLRYCFELQNEQKK